MSRAILTDIEGTTSSISFVKDVLFPYARRALPGFVKARGSEPAVRQWLDQVATESGGMCQDAMIVEMMQGWIDEDRKHTALKALQGNGFRVARIEFLALAKQHETIVIPTLTVYEGYADVFAGRSPAARSSVKT